MSTSNIPAVAPHHPYRGSLLVLLLTKTIHRLTLPFNFTRRLSITGTRIIYHWLAQNLSPVGAGTSKAPNKYGTENDALDPYDTIMTFMYHPSAVLRDGEAGSQPMVPSQRCSEKRTLIPFFC